MISLLAIFGLSFVLCWLLVPAARALALRHGLVDQPDGHRKMHTTPTPVSGGLALLVSCLVSVGAAMFVPGVLRDDLLSKQLPILGLAIGGLVICLVGLADDFGHLRGRHKVVGQILAVSIVLSLGVWVRTIQLFGVNVDLGWLGIPFTIFLMLGAINSLNLIDGMDGLLGSVGLILSLALAAMAALAGHWWAATIAMALAGALMGFLRYNLPPASIFMGDSGSMLVGLILGTLAIHCSLKAPTTLAIAMPVVLMILPIFDTFAAIVRRALTGRSIYTTDRGHLHHCLLRQGFSISAALTLVSVCCVLACGAVLASQAFNNEWIALLTAVSIIGVLIATRIFGHAEAMLIKGRLLAMLLPAGQPRHMEVRLQGSADWMELWHALKICAVELNLQSMLLDVNAPALHEGYHARWDQVAEPLEEKAQLWHVEVPMAASGLAVGRLILSGRPDVQPVWAKIAAVMKVVENFNHPVSTLVEGPSVRVGEQAAAPRLVKTLVGEARPMAGAHTGLGIEAMQS